jgi:gluconolactonase
MKNLIFALLISFSTFAQKTVGKIISLDPSFDKLVDVSEPITVIAEGYEWSEGPVWVKDGEYLLFSDVPKNIIYKWKNSETTVFLSPSGYTGIGRYSNEPGSNGLTITKDGQYLISCEHGDRRISKMPLQGYGGKLTLADKFNGKRFNSPNDLVEAKNGNIYFTDPPYGLAEYEKNASRETPLFGVYMIDKTGKTHLVVSDLIRPNGVALSPDEKTLYVAQSDRKAYIMSYPILANGLLGKGKLFFDASYLNKEGLGGAPDGLKVDQNGNIFSTGPGGVLIISPIGKLLGRIETGLATSNLGWGEDGSTLFITADMYILRLKTKTKGANY